jgi:hypothetical protein
VVARRLLATLDPPRRLRPDLGVKPTTQAQDWADSGLAVVTGETDRRIRHVAGEPATLARAAALAFTSLTDVPLDGPALLSERARSLGLAGRGRVSAGGGTRLLTAADGWWALNLARDLDLVPALIEKTVEPGAAAAWLAVQAWAAERPVAEIIDRTRLLGLAAAGLGETPAPASPWQVRSRPAHKAEPSARALVVNLGSLWAGPLAARLLGAAGARVVHVESRTRPDPTRESSPDFYWQLRDGHEIRKVDFGRPDELIELLSSADIAIEASRPRALRALAADADTIMSDGRARTWLRITGYPDEDRVGFGDDAAVAGGLVCYDANGPAFVGDAIADPLTGLLGALVVLGHRSSSHQSTIELNLAEVAAYAMAMRA